jgi:hypothetical protein
MPGRRGFWINYRCPEDVKREQRPIENGNVTAKELMNG